MLLVGRSTDTDFSTKVCGAPVGTGAPAGTTIGAPGGSGWPTIARTNPARSAVPNPTWVTERLIRPSCCRQVDGLDRVVHEAARIPVRRGRLGQIVAIG